MNLVLVCTFANIALDLLLRPIMAAQAWCPTIYDGKKSRTSTWRDFESDENRDFTTKPPLTRATACRENIEVTYLSTLYNRLFNVRNRYGDCVKQNTALPHPVLKK